MPLLYSHGGGFKIKSTFCSFYLVQSRTFRKVSSSSNCADHTPNIYKEAGKLSVHYSTFPALLPYSCRVHKEQNDQIQESDAGASVRVSAQNRPCAAVCSMSTILLPVHWCHLAGNGETVIVPFNPTRGRH